MTIREETEDDFLEIAALTRAAFGREYEVGLIEKLRTPHLKIASLVAVQEGSVVGHILFSELVVEVDGRNVKTAALAPACRTLPRSGYTEQPRVFNPGLDGWQRCLPVRRSFGGMWDGGGKVAPDFGHAGGTIR